MAGIVQALNNVMADVGAIGKKQKMTEGPAKYAYRGIDDILPAVHAAFIKHGVVAYPRIVEVTNEPVTSRNGAAGYHCTMHVEWRFACEDSEITASVVGESIDYSDKASNKAMTAAMKYALAQVLCIPTVGMQDEQDKHLPEQVRSGGRDCVACGESITGAVVKGSQGYWHKDCYRDEGRPKVKRTDSAVTEVAYAAGEEPF